MKYKLELTTGSHAYIDHVFINIREFEMPQQLKATKMSHEKRIHIFCLYRDYSNSLTFLKASELFWS